MAGAAAMRAGLGQGFPARWRECAGATFQSRPGITEMLADLDARAVLHRGQSAEGLRSTARLLRFSSMSMKSMTISPARSRSRNAAARFLPPPRGWS